MIKDTYIVSGLPRSGSSMMMKILSEGGVPCVPTIEDPNHPFCLANPNGFYELNRDPYLREDYSGQALKALGGRLLKAAQKPYRVVFLLRDIAAVKASYTAAFGRPPIAMLDHRDELLAEITALPYVKLMTINYEDVINNPTQEIQKVADFGFPITDLTSAAVAVDPLLRHY